MQQGSRTMLINVMSGDFLVNSHSQDKQHYMAGSATSWKLESRHHSSSNGGRFCSLTAAAAAAASGSIV
jgi:hypothetical protein